MTHRLLLTAVVALVCISSPDVWARPPRAREITAVIERIDFASRLIVLRDTNTGETHEMEWHDSTKFATNVQELKPGVVVVASYRSPFAGPHRLVKIKQKFDDSP